MNIHDAVVYWSRAVPRDGRKAALTVARRGHPPPGADGYDHRIECRDQDWSTDDVFCLQEELIQRGVRRDVAHREFMRVDQYRRAMAPIHRPSKTPMTPLKRT